eukprot:TRINITY_DN9850_c0_g1_i4.p1 TRINITY_DN9850_c0_g1~~TRINITY_DN9850_c0_g1_i4.p1  ORF type:complete len:773 (-),score=239.04 TRINITY_DN9850_c0_g1_i4:43-2178(-)
MDETPEWKKKLQEKAKEGHLDVTAVRVAESRKHLSQTIELGKTANKWAKQWQEAVLDAFESDLRAEQERAQFQAGSVHHLSEDADRDALVNETVLRQRKAAQVSRNMGKEADTRGATFLSQFFADVIPEEKSALWASGTRFEFSFINQSFAFGNYRIGDPERLLLSRNLARLLCAHSRFPELGAINMYNSGVDDDFVEALCKHILENPDCLPRLECLNFESNLLTDKGITWICKIMGNKENSSDPVLPHLKELRLENQKIPLSSNAEFELENVMRTNPSVLRINYTWRNLTVQTRMAVHLSRNVDSIRSKRLSDPDHVASPIVLNDMQKYLKQIADNDDSITKVEISADPFFLSLKKSEMNDFARSFKKNKFVKVLKLNNLELDKEFALAFAEALAENTALEYVDLEHNKIPTEAVEAIIGSLRTNFTLLTILLNDQSFGPVASSTESVIVEFMQDNHTLTKLGVVFRNKASQLAIERLMTRNQDESRRRRASTAVVPGQRSNKVASQLAIERLMTRNQDESRRRRASTAVVPGQRSNKVAKKSELELFIERIIMNELTEEDRKQENLECVDERFFVSLKSDMKMSFLNAIADNATLKVLKLVRVDLTDIHAEALANSLKKNTTLEELNLEGNKITSAGMQFLIEALAENKSLKKLLLRNQSNNAFLASSAETVLCSVLNTNTTITALGVEIRGMQTTRKLEQTLQKNRKK